MTVSAVNAYPTDRVPAVTETNENVSVPLSVFGYLGTYFATAKAVNVPVASDEYLSKDSIFGSRQSYGDASVAVEYFNTSTEGRPLKLIKSGVYTVTVVARINAPTEAVSTSWPNKFLMNIGTKVNLEDTASTNGMSSLAPDMLLSTHSYERDNTASEDNVDKMQWTDVYMIKTFADDTDISIGIHTFTDMQFVQVSPGVQIEGLAMDLSYMVSIKYHGPFLNAGV